MKRIHPEIPSNYRENSK